MSVWELVDKSSVLAGGVLGLCLLWWMSTRRPSGLPPGPGPALPLLGHLHLMGKDPRARLQTWRRQYGDVFSLYFGSRLVVVFNGFPVIKEAFVKMADVFSDRPHMVMFDKTAEGKGIVFASGPAWKEHRKLSLEILRELGMGKNVLAEKIQEEVTHYIQAIEELQGAPASLHRLTTISVSNNICSIVFGKRFDYDDPVFTMYLENVEENFKLIGGSVIINYLPFLEYIPGDFFKIKKIISNVRLRGSTFYQPQADAHFATYSEDEATDFMYAYIREMKKRENHGTDTSLSESQFSRTVNDLFIAGTETTSTIIAWTLLYFLHHPHVQDKCYNEICDVVGTNRLPNFHDRLRMVYVEATINEVLRIANISPFANQHSTPHDVTFRGYVIPKGAIIMPVMSSVLHDTDTWGDPENFRPERFIGPDGKLTKPEEFIPFSIGRRACLGEALARMELFLYLSSLVQRFRFLTPQPDILPPLEGILGLTLSPKPYKIRAVLRE